MPAKKKAGKGKQVAEPLELPRVSAKDIADAEDVLKNKECRRRANSNMQYWLQTQDKKTKYDEMTPADKKNFFKHWHAASLKEGNATKTATKKP